MYKMLILSVLLLSGCYTTSSIPSSPAEIELMKQIENARDKPGFYWGGLPKDGVCVSGGIMKFHHTRSSKENNYGCAYNKDDNAPTIKINIIRFEKVSNPVLESQITLTSKQLSASETMIGERPLEMKKINFFASKIEAKQYSCEGIFFEERFPSGETLTLKAKEGQIQLPEIISKGWCIPFSETNNIMPSTINSSENSNNSFYSIEIQ